MACVEKHVEKKTAERSAYSMKINLSMPHHVRTSRAKTALLNVWTLLHTLRPEMFCIGNPNRFGVTYTTKIKRAVIWTTDQLTSSSYILTPL